MEGFQKNEVPGFLIKTYRLVDDSDTDDVISWSKDNKSFIVWSPITFAEELLPKHFKHNNFSSFIRQLNTYGFRKIDPDRFEFANERFARDQPHLMKEIVRRKYDSRHHSQQPLGTQQQFETGSRNFSVEVGNFGGLKEEIERFKRDKNILLKEVVKLRQQQQANQRIMQVTKQRLRRTEQVEQQMMSFLAKAVESPDVLAQLVRQTQQKKRVQKGGTLTRQGNSNSSSEQSGSKGQIIKYHSNCNDNVRPKLLDQILRFSSLSHLPISSTGTSNSGELRNFDPVPSDLDNAFLSTVQENPTNVLPREKVHGQSPQIGLIETSDTVFVNENETVHSNYCQAKFELAASGVDSASSDMMVKAMHVEEPKLQNPSDFSLDRISRDVLPCDVVNGESQMGLIETSDHTASVNETETDHLNHCQTTIKIPASGVDIASSDMMVKGMHTEEPNPSDWLLDLLYSDISSLDLDDLLPDLDFPEIVGTGF